MYHLLGPSIGAGGLSFPDKVGQRLSDQSLRGILASGEAKPVNATQLDKYQYFP